MSKGTDPFQEIEQIFDQLTQFGGSMTTKVPVDVIETSDELIVQADLPGRDPDAIDVQLRDNRRLSIEAGPPLRELEGNHVRRERTDRGINRTVRLPSIVQRDDTEASYDRGVLTVRLAKPTGEDEGTDIPVN